MIMYIIDNGKCAQESQNTTVLYQQWQMHLKNNGILIAMTTLQLQLQHENKQWPQNRVLLHFLYMILRASIVLDMVFSTSNAASQWQHPHDTVHLQYLWESELVLCSSLLPMACIVAWEVGMKAKDTRNIAKWHMSCHKEVGPWNFRSNAQERNTNAKYQLLLDHLPTMGAD